MSAFLDIIILLFVVLMVFGKLKSLLGTRPDNETEISKESAAKIFDILMQEQKNKAKPSSENKTELQTDESNLSESDKILNRLPNFNRNKFLNGARKAFEMIVNSFASGDTATLKPLLSKDLFEKFEGVIEQRKQEGITAETDLIGINEAVIVDAKTEDNDMVRVCVKFVSEQVNILRNKDGEVIEGDENFIQSITDVWTFERQINASTPNWTLISTKK